MPARPRTLVTPNYFVHLPTSQAALRIPTIVFFVSGNPGLIAYYHIFLNLLCQSTPRGRNESPAPTVVSQDQGTPSSDSTADNCVVAGFSLGGFELTESTTTVSSTLKVDEDNDIWSDENLDNILYPPDFERKAIYGLQDQIELCYARLVVLVAKVRDEYGSSTADENGQTASHECSEDEEKTRPRINVILMGHSVGAYIALEIIRRHHAESQSQPQPQLPSPETALDTQPTTTKTPSFKITSAVLLTPTILNISHSPSGRLATPLLTYIPFLPTLLQLASSTFTALFSNARLSWLVGKATGMKAGSEALSATVGFLRSRGAVRQALFLAGEEMREIGADSWGEEVWGVMERVGQESESHGIGEKGGRGGGGGGGGGWETPMLYFWFAKDDHWVADVTREEIVKMVRERFGKEEGARSNRRRGRPEIVVDEDEGLVHAWCIEQSQLVAKKVKLWLESALKE